MYKEYTKSTTFVVFLIVHSSDESEALFGNIEKGIQILNFTYYLPSLTFLFDNKFIVSMMAETQDSIFDKVTNPYLQGAICLSFGVAFLLMGGIMSGLGLMEWDINFPYTTTGAMMLFYAMFSSIISIKIDDLNKYWQKSILGYAAMTGILMLLAYLITGKPVTQVASFAWIYQILTFSFLAFLSIIGFIKFIFTFLVKGEDTK